MTGRTGDGTEGDPGASEPAPSRAASVGAAALSVVGGTLLVLSIRWPVAADGLGSAISGQALGDLLLGGTVDAWAPRWAGLALYLQPVCGALVLAGTGWGGRAGRAVALVALAVAVLAWTVLGLTLGGRNLTDPGPGSVVAGAGLVAIAAGSAAHLLAPRRAARRANQVAAQPSQA